MYFKLWLINEGQTENQALKILDNNVEVLQQLIRIDPTPQKKFLPAIAYFFKQGATQDQLLSYFEKFKNLENKKLAKPLEVRKNGTYYDGKPVNFLGWTEIIDGIITSRRPVQNYRLRHQRL